MPDADIGTMLANCCGAEFADIDIRPRMVMEIANPNAFTPNHSPEIDREGIDPDRFPPLIFEAGTLGGLLSGELGRSGG